MNGLMFESSSLTACSIRCGSANFITLMILLELPETGRHFEGDVCRMCICYKSTIFHIDVRILSFFFQSVPYFCENFILNPLRGFLELAILIPPSFTPFTYRLLRKLTKPLVGRIWSTFFTPTLIILGSSWKIEGSGRRDFWLKLGMWSCRLLGRGRETHLL